MRAFTEQSLGVQMRGCQVLLLALFVTSVSLAEQAHPDDALISVRVKSALIAAEATKAGQINVETQQGIVQLSGFVDSSAMRTAAERVTRTVDGVVQVQNKLMVRDRDRTLGEAVDDTAIAARIKSELASKAGLETAARVNVEVNSGVVELSGFVATLEEKTQAAAIARAVAGVEDVHDSIALKPQS